MADEPLSEGNDNAAGGDEGIVGNFHSGPSCAISTT